MSNYIDFDQKNNQQNIQRPNFGFGITQSRNYVVPTIPSIQDISMQNISGPILNQPIQQILENQEESKPIYLIIQINTKAQQISLIQHGYCLVVQKLKEKIENMYLNAVSIFLIFKNKQDKKWIGCAKMTTRLDDMDFFPSDINEILSKADQQFDSKCYAFSQIEWNHLYFENSENIINPYNLKYPIYKCKDGQEIEEKAANQIIQLLKYSTQQNQQSWRPNLDVEDPQSSQSSDEQANEVQKKIQPSLIDLPPINIINQPSLIYPNQVIQNNPFNIMPTPYANITANIFQAPIAQEIQKDLFFFRYLINNERESVFKKGYGPLGEFFIKSLKEKNRSESSSESDRSRHRRKTTYMPRQDKAREKSRKRKNSKDKKRKQKRDQSRSRDRNIRKYSNSNSRDRKKTHKRKRSSSSRDNRKKVRKSRRSQSPKDQSYRKNKQQEKQKDYSSNSDKSLNNYDYEEVTLQQIINGSPNSEEKGKVKNRKQK